MFSVAYNKTYQRAVQADSQIYLRTFLTIITPHLILNHLQFSFLFRADECIKLVFSLRLCLFLSVFFSFFSTCFSTTSSTSCFHDSLSLASATIVSYCCRLLFLQPRVFSYSFDSAVAIVILCPGRPVIYNINIYTLRP